MSAQSRGWGPGWPNCQTSKLVTLTVSDLRLPVRAEVAPIFAALVLDLEDARGEKFRRDWSWGFACRAISGTSTASNHSWGLAIDLDAPTNPYQRGVPGPGRNTMPSNASALADKYGCRWGGDYRSSADPMHFEFMGSPTYAQTIIDRYDLRSKEEQMLKRGDGGDGVALFQRCLLAWNPDALPEWGADGDYGEETETWVKKYQRSADIQETGRIDGVTAALLSTYWERDLPLTRIEGSGTVYQPVGRYLFALNDSGQAAALAKLLGLHGKWQSHVGDLTKSEASAFTVVKELPDGGGLSTSDADKRYVKRGTSVQFEL